MEGAKNFEAFGWLIMIEFAEVLPGEGRQRVCMMIDTPRGQSSVLVFFLNVSMKRTIGIEASHDMTGRRVDTGTGKREGKLPGAEGGSGSWEERRRHCGGSQLR